MNRYLFRCRLTTSSHDRLERRHGRRRKTAPGEHGRELGGGGREAGACAGPRNDTAPASGPGAITAAPTIRDHRRGAPGRGCAGPMNRRERVPSGGAHTADRGGVVPIAVGVALPECQRPSADVEGLRRTWSAFGRTKWTSMIAFGCTKIRAPQTIRATLRVWQKRNLAVGFRPTAAERAI